MDAEGASGFALKEALAGELPVVPDDVDDTSGSGVWFGEGTGGQAASGTRRGWIRGCFEGSTGGQAASGTRHMSSSGGECVEALSGVGEATFGGEGLPDFGGEVCGWCDGIDVGGSSAGGVAAAEAGFVGEALEFESFFEGAECRGLVVVGEVGEWGGGWRW